MTETTVTAVLLNDLRQRYLDGKSWSREELKGAIHAMIGQRLEDVKAVGTGAKKAKAAPVSLDDMLPGTEPEPEVSKTTEPSVPKPSGGFF